MENIDTPFDDNTAAPASIEMTDAAGNAPAENPTLPETHSAAPDQNLASSDEATLSEKVPATTPNEPSEALPDSEPETPPPAEPLDPAPTGDEVPTGETAPALVPSKAASDEARILKRGASQIAVVHEVLGIPAALLPIYPRSKVPAMRRWQRLSTDYMDLPEFIRMFGVPDRGVGVLLGAKSQGLVAFDFDDMHALRAFLRLNKQVRKTLTTQGSPRGATLWLQMTGAYPASFDIKNPDGTKGNLMEFRADNKRGKHPCGKYYQIRLKAVPMKVAFADIKWPEGWTIPSEENPVPATYDFLSAMMDTTASEEARFGEPFTVGEKGSVAINYFAFADLFTNAYPIMHVPNLGFLVYEDFSGCWKLVNDEEVHRRLAMFFEYLAQRHGIQKFRYVRTIKNLTELVTILKGLLSEELPQRPHDLLHLANGMIDTGDPDLILQPFSPLHFSRSASPVSYRADAGCPRWLEFLHTALPKSDVELLQRWSGLALSGYNSMQAILVLTGVGGSGKGVYVDVTSRIAGRQNCAELRTRHLNERFELANYILKTLLIGSDVPGDFLNLSGAHRVKALTGHDELQAEIKYEPRPTSIRGTFNMVITSNQHLRVALDGDEEAYRRRLKIVHFSKKAPEQNPHFADELFQDEASGILNWMIEGLITLRAEVAYFGEWKLSSEQDKRIDDLLAGSDSLRAFVRDHITKAGPSENITTEELHLAYESACDDLGWGPQTKHRFQTLLPDLMLEAHGVCRRNDIPRGAGSRRGFWGVRVRRDIEK